MVFCRGCAKEIHETAVTCPSCGAPQNLPNIAVSKRTTGVLIVVAAGWTLLFWLGGLFIGGMIVGMLNVNDAENAGAKFGAVVSIPLLLFSAIVSGILTKFGQLPGTKKSQ